MVAMEEVRPAQEANFEMLREEYEVLSGYVQGMGGSMYVAICNAKGIEISLSEEMRAYWDPH